MANIYEGMNVRQKLAKARLYFLNQKVTKSGKNMSLEFKYFELEDIVPVAIRIFARVGLTSNTVFNGETATMTIFNTDNREEPGIEFVAPYREVGQIISNKGKEVTNPMQALGSSITYLRRYLWMMALRNPMTLTQTWAQTMRILTLRLLPRQRRKPRKPLLLPQSVRLRRKN